MKHHLYHCRVFGRLVAVLLDVIHVSTSLPSQINNFLQFLNFRFFLIFRIGRTWNTGNFGPDAICFSVDRRGIAIAGAVVYSGTGSYEYEMELLYDTLDTPIHKWEPLESISGTYDQDIVKNEMAELKFARPVHIKVEFDKKQKPVTLHDSIGWNIWPLWIGKHIVRDSIAFARCPHMLGWQWFPIDSWTMRSNVLVLLLRFKFQWNNSHTRANSSFVILQHTTQAGIDQWQNTNWNPCQRYGTQGTRFYQTLLNSHTLLTNFDLYRSQVTSRKNVRICWFWLGMHWLRLLRRQKKAAIHRTTHKRLTPNRI